MNFGKKALVVSHDSGGAECLSSYLLKNRINFKAYLKGPAKKIFLGKFKKKLKIVNFKNALKNIDHIITSTSWSSNIEKKFILKAKKKKIKTISILDHWINYKERFIYREKLVLPDKILTLDAYAQAIAKKNFPFVKIYKIENDYIKDFVKKYKKNPKKKYFLYLSEPLNNFFSTLLDENKLDYDEFDALKYFLKNFKKIFNYNMPICIRLHPSDHKNKYNKIVKNFKSDLNIFFSKNKYLEDDIALAIAVFGCETMAMAQAVILKKKVISVIPDFSNQNCRLPFSQIKYLRHLVKKTL
jgi:hypothetical protein